MSSTYQNFISMQQATFERIFSTSAKPITESHSKIIARYVEPLSRLMPEYGINTILRQAHFLAQLAQESGEFRATEENLKYSATRLMEVFPKYFRTTTEARAAAYDEKKIANIVYANRLGNGNASSYDGYNFRGRGLIQLTGRDNYTAFLNHLRSLPQSSLPKIQGVSWSALFAAIDPAAELAPLLSVPELAVRSACFFWKRNNLNALADQGATDAAVTAVTRRVNGGTHGLSQRKIYFYRAHIALKAE